MANQHYFQARAVAGRSAVVIASEHDRETACDMTRGLMAGFLLACTQYAGWDAVLREINELAAVSRVPVVAEKPKLKIVNGENA